MISTAPRPWIAYPPARPSHSLDLTYHSRVAGSRLRNVTAVRSTAVVVTEVEFSALDRSTVEWYVRSREWEGRAGGYAIQGRGAALISGIRGDYLNVVGLPLARLLKLHPDLHPATPISRGSAGGVR